MNHVSNRLEFRLELGELEPRLTVKVLQLERRSVEKDALAIGQYV